MRPYTIIAFAVNGYASLTGFASLPLFRWLRIRSQQCENAMWDESRYLPILWATNLKTFILQSGEWSRGETIWKMHSAARCITSQQCRQLLQVHLHLLHTSNKRKLHTVYCNEQNYNRLQSIKQHQAMERSRLTRTTILHPNAYDWWEPNEKSTSHDRRAPTKEILSANEILLQRSTTQWKFTQRRCHPAKLTDDDNEHIVIGY